MSHVNRRQFLASSTQAACQVAVGAAVLAGTVPSTRGGEAGKRRPEVMVVYYPHWHSYDHGSAWKGEGWTEWEGMKAAVPRFDGHHQPLEPTWGYFDESDPAWAAREIDLAVSHGIDIFLFDWYWYSGVKNMEEALEQGFLKAPNRDRMKFALMWANHDRRDQFCPEFGKDRTVWLPSRHSPRDMRRVIDYCIEHYFRQPNYWRPDGKLFFSIFEPEKFIAHLGGPAETRAVLAELDGRLRQVDLPPMHWNAMAGNLNSAILAKDAGFHSTSRYNVHSAGKVQPDLTERYEDVMEAHRKHWQSLRDSTIPDLPVVTMGWDASPRCSPDVAWPFPPSPKSEKYKVYEYPYVPIIVGNTPERFEQLLRDVAEHIAQDPRQPPAVLINAWNEWTEGCYLLPEKRTGNAYLEAIRRVFGTRE